MIRPWCPTSLVTLCAEDQTDAELGGTPPGSLISRRESNEEREEEEEDLEGGDTAVVPYKLAGACLERWPVRKLTS